MRDYANTIRGLMEKANSPSLGKEERDLFLSKAVELQTRYNVDVAQKVIEEKETLSRGNFNIDRVTWAHENAATILRAFFNVKVVTLRHQTPIQVAILGRKSAVYAAKYIYDFIVREFNRAWLESGRKGSAKAFYRGLYLAQKEKLSLIKDCPGTLYVGTQEESRAICLSGQMVKYEKSENQILEEYLLREFPNAKGGKGRTSKGLDRDSIKKGKEAGKKISIRKGLPSTDVKGKNKHLAILNDK